MGASILFVDSLAADATVRLDVNDGVTWFCQNFSAPPPRLRRSVSQNAMRDGQYVSASSYEARTLTLELTLVDEIAEEFAAQSMQALWRELDRPDNWLLYQPTTLDEPVFFRLSRSDVSEFEELWTSPIARNITVELVAEPFALGLPESLGPFTVSNDPAAATNGCYFDVSGVKGDVSAPCVIVDSQSALSSYVLAARQSGDVTDTTAFVQAESATPDQDTTNIGGGPDAVMSGAGTNNFLRTSFATVPTMASRVIVSPVVRRGTYRVYAAVRRSDATSVMRVALTHKGATSAAVTVYASTSRQIVDCGLVTFCSADKIGHGPANDFAASDVYIEAARDSGAGTLDWDFIAFIPVDEQCIVRHRTGGLGGDTALDSVREQWSEFTSGDPLAGTAVIPETTTSPASVVNISGSFPRVVPVNTNRFYTLTAFAAGPPFGIGADKTQTQVLTIHYWPHYLYVRPSAS